MLDLVSCGLPLNGPHRTVLIHARDKAVRCQRAATGAIVRSMFLQFFPRITYLVCIYLLIVREESRQFLLSKVCRRSDFQALLLYLALEWRFDAASDLSEALHFRDLNIVGYSTGV